MPCAAKRARCDACADGNEELERDTCSTVLGAENTNAPRKGRDVGWPVPNPFILTATIPEPLRGYAEGLRRRHFPPERNHLHAHVTMFHAFAPSLLEELKSFIPQIVSEFAPPRFHVSGLLDLGKGTAIRLETPELLSLRGLIAEHFHGALTDQDLHEPRPHITIQNKVSKDTARALQAELTDEIAGWCERGDFEFPSFELHRYLGGPWEHIKTFPFRGSERA